MYNYLISLKFEKNINHLKPSSLIWTFLLAAKIYCFGQEVYLCSLTYTLNYIFLCYAILTFKKFVCTLSIRSEDCGDQYYEAEHHFPQMRHRDWLGRKHVTKHKKKTF